MFITLEGPEGCGKTSQIPLLAEFLRQQGCEVLATREPGGTSIGEQIRGVIGNLANTEMQPRTEILLFQASRAGQRLRHMSNVVVLEGYAPQEVKGDVYARSLIVGKGNDVRELFGDAIFVELGLKPNSGFLGNLVELEEDGRIKIDARNRTSRPGIFAAGDVTDVYAEQVLIAIGEGAKAALSVYDYLLTLPIEEPAAAVAGR